MTELTPERIRDAAEVLRQVNVYTGGSADLENLWDGEIEPGVVPDLIACLIRALPGWRL